MDISEIIKNKRNELSITQNDLAQSLYVSKRSITNWETGKTTPDIDTLVRLAKLYDISLDDLLLDNKEAVNNIKKQARLTLLNRYLLATFITFIAFFFILSTTGLFGDLAKPVLVATYIGAFANIVSMVYFLSEINKLEDKSEKDLVKDAIKWTFLGITLVILSIILIVMAKYI